MNQAKEREWQDKLEERSNAVFLVRDILGCTCPEETFDHYQVQHNVSEAIPMVQLIMGNRRLNIKNLISNEEIALNAAGQS